MCLSVLLLYPIQLVFHTNNNRNKFLVRLKTFLQLLLSVFGVVQTLRNASWGVGDKKCDSLLYSKIVKKRDMGGGCIRLFCVTFERNLYSMNRLYLILILCNTSL